MFTIKQRKNIVAAVNNVSVNYFIYKGQIKGLDYDLLKTFADSLNLTLEIVPVNNLQEMTVLLKNGQADIGVGEFYKNNYLKNLGYTMSLPYGNTKFVLVQRKNNNVIDNLEDLKGKNIVVLKNSTEHQILKTLPKNILNSLKILAVPNKLNTERLIYLVSVGIIDYTIAEYAVAKSNQLYYTNIDISLNITSAQKKAWLLRENSQQLLLSVNRFLQQPTTQQFIKQLEANYIFNNDNIKQYGQSFFYVTNDQKLSQYNDIIKQYAKQYKWDWRLITALIYQESNFDTLAIGQNNMYGLMQISKKNIRTITNDTIIPNANDNIRIGIAYLTQIRQQWQKTIKDSVECLKFTIASYNAGIEHVEDARRLAKKYGYNPFKWDNNVEFFLKMKSYPKFYKDNAVRYGYCRGYITEAYVKNILNRYKHYQNFVRL